MKTTEGIDTKGGINKGTSDCIYTRAGMLPPPKVSAFALFQDAVASAMVAKIDRQMMGLAALILLALLTGCGQENIKQGLDNLSKDCDRHYTFSASTGGVGGIGGSLTVAGTADCKAEHAPAPAAAPAPGQ